MQTSLKLLVVTIFFAMAGQAHAQSYSLQEVCAHYTDSVSTCARIPFCRFAQGQSFCEKISPPSSPYACQIFNSDAEACDKYTFGNCRWNAGQPSCAATRSRL